VRTSQGRIGSLHALCDELDLRLVNKRVLESLVKAGAFDALVSDDAPLGARRARLMATVDLACEHGARRQRDRRLGQGQPFGGGSDEGGEPIESLASPASVTPWTEAQQLAYEKEALGLYWTGHPIDRVASELKALGAKTTAELAGGGASGASGVNGGNG